jgi:uracil-DNA glycosylase
MARLNVLSLLDDHLAELRGCARCPSMVGPVVAPPAVVSRVYLCGQAPGPHEAKVGRPFGWTAGKTLFRWFDGLGVDEETFRKRVYIGAVCRCFPGKTKQGGDRVPSPGEIEACAPHMARELAILKPKLVIAVGKLAIERVLGKAPPLAEVVGKQVRAAPFGHECDVIPLPHPSGASTWFKVEPGRTLLGKALRRIAKHEAWEEVGS